MCRSIKTLRRAEQPATDEEIAAAARQFVRKVSGRREPPAKDGAAYEAAVAEIARTTARLLGDLGPPRASSRRGAGPAEPRPRDGARGTRRAT